MNTSSPQNGVSAGLEYRGLLDRFIMLEAVLEQILQPLLLKNMSQLLDGHDSVRRMEASATDDIIDQYIASHPNEYLEFLRLSPREIEEQICSHELALARINQQQMEFS